MKNSDNLHKKPWSTKKAMDQIYKNNLWGRGKSNFFSGDGSHDSAILNPYLKALSLFLTSFNKPLTIVDLGCGDFNVGNQLLHLSENYIGVDIVETLIQRNKDVFKDHNLKFYCLDIALDKLPEGDIALLRQVLQHLSNKEIYKIIRKLPSYKYVVLTEHIPEGNFDANIDLVSGQGTRLKKNSGVDLFQPPFNLKVKNSTSLLTLEVKKWKGIIVTTLLEMY